MCGIFGMVSSNPISIQQKYKFDQMSDLAQHRGPDSVGTYFSSKLLVGMSRLKIVGLANGDQPIWNKSKTVGIVANGEIYNFIEIRSELTALGYKFSTLSDIESILVAYEHYGLKLAGRLRGMFGFAIFDLEKNQLILGRDSAGEKPLYIHQSADTISFASELTILAKSKVVDFSIDTDSLSDYFKYGFIPEPGSILKNVKKIQPGSLQIIDLNTLAISNFNFQTEFILDSKSSTEEISLRNEILNVSNKIFQGEVPMGIALSGGLDSTLIAALAAKQNKKVCAFSVGYKGYSNSDESEMARKTADYFGLDFTRIEISPNDVAIGFVEMVAALDEPLADPASYAYFALGKKAKEQGVRVLFSGHGGDELFWGYKWINKSVSENIRRNSTLNFRFHFQDYLKFDPIKFTPGGLIQSFKTGFGLFENLIQMYEDLKSRKQMDRYLLVYERGPRARERKKFSKKLIRNFSGTIPKQQIGIGFNDDEIADQVKQELMNTYLRVNGLAQIDRLWMKNSIEGRTLLVDAGISYKAKTFQLNKYSNTSIDKAALKYAIKSLIPEELIPKNKKGFTPPFRKWVKAINRELKLDSEHLRVVELGLMNPCTSKYIKNPLSRIGRPKILWLEIIILEVWIREIEKSF
jgi:asparagine synthase (glutamine-hydrolysing)